MGWICEEEYWIGLVISGWHVGDIIQISSICHPHISPKYHQHIIQISSIYHPVDIFYSPPTWWKSSFNPDMARLAIPLLIIQILPKYHPNIIQKSLRNYPEIIQKSFRNHTEIGQISSSRHRFNDFNYHKFNDIICFSCTD